MSLESVLVWYEMLVVSQVGSRRNIQTMQKGWKAGNTGGTPDMDAWACHINGAGGEMAFAKAMNFYWNHSVGTFRRKPDVGGMEVRTRSKHHWDLIVREDDSDSSIFVLVTGQIPRYQIHGWIMGGDAKQDNFLQNHGDYKPAWFVPQCYLRPLEELKHAPL